jgi:hypothetical protein
MSIDYRNQMLHRPSDSESANQAPILLTVQKLDRLISVYQVRGRFVEQEIVDVVGVQSSQASFETSLSDRWFERLVAGQGATAALQISLDGRHGIDKPPRHALHDTDCRHPCCRIKAKLRRHCHRFSTPA